MKEIFVKMVLDAWTSRIRQTDKLLSELSDADLTREIAPGKNRGIYLLGHLAAVHDKLFYILDLGEPIYPQYEAIFVDNADHAMEPLPPVTETRKAWNDVNTQLSKQFSTIQPDQWFQRHLLVPEGDFVTEPHRNKLNVIINRTNHLEYHLGQLVLLKSKG
jgi:hypothetical protein